MKRKRNIFWLLLTVLTLGCSSIPRDAGIEVTVRGDVVSPGTYALPTASTVGALLDKAGGLGKLGGLTRGDGVFPKRVIINRNGVTVEYKLKATENWRDVPLRDSDVVNFPIVVF